MKVERKPIDDPVLGMAPMIDMTFLLLIFFMVTTKIQTEQKKIEIKMPVAKSARIPADASEREMINIDEQGQLYSGTRPMDKKELKAYLIQRLKDFPPLKVYVRADGRTPGKKIKEIMAICSEAGAIEVIFGAYTK
jgi:biopolymer transport protein ExbD